MTENFNIKNDGSYSVYNGEEIIGSCSIQTHQYFDYPDCPNLWKGKPVLEITGLGITEEVHAFHSGYGRSMLLACYEYSQKIGCEGRIAVPATWGNGSFYEHCGFRGDKPGEDGMKYFEPTPENIEKLFKNKRNHNLSFHPVSFAGLELNIPAQEDNLSEPENQSEDKSLPKTDRIDTPSKFDRLEKNTKKTEVSPTKEILAKHRHATAIRPEILEACKRKLSR